MRLDRLDEVNAVLIDWYGAPDEVARCVDVSDVERVDVNALRALAPLPRAPVPQAIGPHSSHAAPAGAAGTEQPPAQPSPTWGRERYGSAAEIRSHP